MKGPRYSNSTDVSSSPGYVWTYIGGISCTKDPYAAMQRGVRLVLSNQVQVGGSLQISIAGSCRYCIPCQKCTSSGGSMGLFSRRSLHLLNCLGPQNVCSLGSRLFSLLVCSRKVKLPFILCEGSLRIINCEDRNGDFYIASDGRCLCNIRPLEQMAKSNRSGFARPLWDIRAIT